MTTKIHVPVKTKTASPYVAGKPIDELAREFGLDPKAIIKLASNENPLGMSPKAAAAVAALNPADVARYPDANGFALKNKIAQHHNVDPSSIVLGNGSENLIELVAKAFVEPGSTAVSSQYGFIVFAQSIHNLGGVNIVVPAKELACDLDAMLAAVTETTVAIYLANPNNPTGTFVEPKRMRQFLSAVPPSVLVVLDEAYTEFLPPESRFDGTQYPAEFPNVIVTRTFSKAYGLAGLRVAYSVSDPEVADYMNRVRTVFNVNEHAQVAAFAALDDSQFLAATYELNRSELIKMQTELERLGLSYIPSAGNFVLFEVPDAPKINLALLHDGIIVRPMGMYGLTNWIRVSIGNAIENAAFVGALERALSQ